MSVQILDCVGPDGKPKQVGTVARFIGVPKQSHKHLQTKTHFSLLQPGDKWTSNCNNCVCDEDSMSIQCEPIECPEVQSPNCTEDGQELVNKTEGCCPTLTCGQLESSNLISFIPVNSACKKNVFSY